MDKFFNLLLTLAIVALATTLVLPGRQTPAIVREGFGGLADLTNASIGRG